jgi:AraC family transcriptional regulator
MGLTRTDYYKSDLISVRYVACRTAERKMSDVEHTNEHRLILPLRGSFMEHFSRSSQVLAEPTLALIFPAGRSSRVSHPVSPNDDCLVIGYSDSSFAEVMETARHALCISSLHTHSLLTPPIMAARNLILYRLVHKLADPLEVEETALALLSFSIQSSRENRITNRHNAKIAKQIEAAKVILLSHPEKKWNLLTLARLLKSSPYHLTRSFGEKVGIPLHRYQQHIRLARSIDLLLDTDQDVTTIALDLGFSSHSHFTAAFRQTIGLTPNSFRQAASSHFASETRKILIARLS